MTEPFCTQWLLMSLKDKENFQLSKIIPLFKSENIITGLERNSLNDSSGTGR